MSLMLVDNWKSERVAVGTPCHETFASKIYFVLVQKEKRELRDIDRKKERRKERKRPANIHIRTHTPTQILSHS